MNPAVFTIPLHRSFADALAAGLIARFAGDRIGLASAILLVPNNRAAVAIQDAFVRRSDGGLLLPRLVPVGDPELEERIGGMLEPIDAAEMAPVPPAIEPVERLMLLARLVQRHHEPDAAEALRLAQELAHTLDQLLIEEVEPARLADFAADLPDLSLHWQKSLDRLRLILADWPAMLRERGRIDLADRRNRLLSAVARRWKTCPPLGLVCAAGVSTSAPAVVRLLRTIARMPGGMIVFPGIDLDMSQEEWLALGPHAPDDLFVRSRPSIESHPQFHIKLLLDRIGVNRGEVQHWLWSGGKGSPASRGRAAAHAMAPASFTEKWQHLSPAERRLSGVRALEVADPAEEAQAIATALRGALEEEGKTAALVTPDRALARRVSAHLARWGIEADDSAGRPLAQTPSGTLLLCLTAAAAERFAPVPLLALLKHPLVMAGEMRLPWLDGVRRLDLALRGPRPPAGIDGTTRYLADRTGRDAALREQAERWWLKLVPRLLPIEQCFERSTSLPNFLSALREAADRLAGDSVWSGAAGRVAADLIAELEAGAGEGPEQVKGPDLTAMLERLMALKAVRPVYGQHPRLFIWGLLEARLQHADLMILGGLNEGVWPAAPAPDPWLAPRLRADLGLPSLERRIGLAAHDFAMALGARQVLVTRARRDTRAPTVASRFWLRLEAMTGGLTRAPLLRKWAGRLDRPDTHRPADRPAPSPEKRPDVIWVTDVDRLKADPFAFYAKRILRLSSLDTIDADPTPAWRGSAVHAVLEAWMKEDDCDPERLRSRAEALLAGAAAHPLMRALWQPRLMEAIDFVAAEVQRNAKAGRLPVAAEVEGKREIAGVTLRGRVDRIDRRADGTLAIIDYKTGNPPTNRAVAEGYSLQLGLLGLIAEAGGFAEIGGLASCFEYWSLARKAGKLGHVASPADGRNGIGPDEFISLAARHFIDASGRWLTSGEPFTAKLHPEYAPYQEYDQLMRLDEWYGRNG